MTVDFNDDSRDFGEEENNASFDTDDIGDDLKRRRVPSSSPARKKKSRYPGFPAAAAFAASTFIPGADAAEIRNTSSGFDFGLVFSIATFTIFALFLIRALYAFWRRVTKKMQMRSASKQFEHLCGDDAWKVLILILELRDVCTRRYTLDREQSSLAKAISQYAPAFDVSHFQSSLRYRYDHKIRQSNPGPRQPRQAYYLEQRREGLNRFRQYFGACSC